MTDIKVKDNSKKEIKVLNKVDIINQNLKDTVQNAKEKSDITKDDSVNEYGSNKINKTTIFAVEKSAKLGKKIFVKTRNTIRKTRVKLKSIKEKKFLKRNFKSNKKSIKTSKEVIKNTKKVANKAVKASQRAVKLARQTARATVKGIKLAVKITISVVKAIIMAMKSLISVIVAGGTVSLIIIVIICLVGLLLASVFGIFFSNEKKGSGITMSDLITECNQEFSNKLQEIQSSNTHDDYVLEGNTSSWKDVLIIYAVKESNNGDKEIMTIDDTKKDSFKKIFWDMNTISSEVKDETVTEQGVNTDEQPEEVEKKVLHVTVTTKTPEQMQREYKFNDKQIKQYNELSSDKYSALWNSVIYGADSGEYSSWRQKGASWSNVKIGNTNSTISDIGCLVTSIAILIKKSGVDTNNIQPFNPGTFVEALNKNGGFSDNGNLQYGAISKVVPKFKYIGNVDLRYLIREEKLEMINKYINQGYYLTIEVKGATETSQHWVAIVGINGNSINIVDPISDNTDLWNAYEWKKSTQFNYFKAD